jgi:hypothetical protein
MGRKPDLELIKKVVKFKKEGKTFTEMSEIIGYTRQYLFYVYKNRYSLAKKHYGITEDVDKLVDDEGISWGTKSITFELPIQDYERFNKIKKEIIERLEMGTDEYVFMKLLDAYDELKRIKEKEQEYLDYLKYIGFEVIEK